MSSDSSQPWLHQHDRGPVLLADLNAGGLVMFIGSGIAIGLAALFIRHGQAMGTGTFHGAFARQMAAAGLSAPQGHDDDASLAAYNAYLQAVSGGGNEAVA